MPASAAARGAAGSEKLWASLLMVRPQLVDSAAAAPAAVAAGSQQVLTWPAPTLLWAAIPLLPVDTMHASVLQPAGRCLADHPLERQFGQVLLLRYAHPGGQMRQHCLGEQRNWAADAVP